MSEKSKKFTEEEKAAIALKAGSGGEEAIKKLAIEHGVPEEEIRNWIREMGVSSVDESEEEVSLEASEDFAKSVEYGATFDKLNFPRLTFWSVFGVSVILIFVIALMYIHDYTRSSATLEGAQQSRYYNIEEVQQRDRAKLESFGVVDPDEGIYRIPIDSAITLIVNE
jgi:hypothetical protein